MQHYRAYFPGPDGHILSVVDLSCENDEEASEKACQLVEGQDVELWQGERFLNTFKTSD